VLAEVKRIAETRSGHSTTWSTGSPLAEKVAAGAAAAAVARQPAARTADESTIGRSCHGSPNPTPMHCPSWSSGSKRVLSCYPRTTEALSDCWPYHPWVVEELVALNAAWVEAYQGERASGAKAVDWHDRHLTGTLNRIHSALAIVPCGARARPARRSP
jgi:hypothetical protein